MPSRNLADRTEAVRTWRGHMQSPEEKRAYDRLVQKMHRLEEEIIKKLGSHYRVITDFHAMYSKQFLVENLTESPLKLLYHTLHYPAFIYAFVKSFDKRGNLINRGPFLVPDGEPNDLLKTVFLVKRDFLRKDHFLVHFITVLDRNVIPHLSPEELEKLKRHEAEGSWHEVRVPCLATYKDGRTKSDSHTIIMYAPTHELFQYYADEEANGALEYETRFYKMTTDPYLELPSSLKSLWKVHGRPRRFVD